ncbi:MAG: thrombospondin type 3 repeat-containing protein, partial [Chloroflexota bacterium]
VTMCNAMPASFIDAQIAGNPACAQNLATSATADTYTQTDLVGADLNVATRVTFVPNTVTIAAGGTIPAGTKIGGTRRNVTVGAVNNACDTSGVITDYVLFNVALPNNLGVPRASSNIVYPRPAGSPQRFDGWQVGSAPSPSGGTAPVDAGNGTATGASLAIQNYPSFLLDLFDPGFPAQTASVVAPLAVYGGLSKDASGDWVPFYVVQFAAGALAALPAPYNMMNANVGQPTVPVLGDPTTVPSPTNLTTVCNPSSVSTVLLGKDPSNTFTRATSPASSGTQLYMQYNASVRDTDQDGYDNSIDTCPTKVNLGSPHIFADGDTDGDGIDSACDTDLPAALGNDVDSDGFRNRQDNCPQVANATQVESEVGTNTVDRGPHTDLIGDACDSEVTSITITQNGQPVTIAMSDTIANGRYLTTTKVVAKCIAGTDVDGDGYCVSGGVTTDNADSGTCGSTVPPSCATRHNAWSGATHPALQMDTDLDKQSDAVETYLGSDVTKACAQTTTANDEDPRDNWPLDFSDDGIASVPDVIKFGAAFGKNIAAGSVTVSGYANPVPIARFDLNVDGQVSVPDMLKLSPVFGRKCGAIGTLGIPDWAQQ